MVFPRIIWFMWLQGEDAMPPICQLCLRSWRKWNPDYDLRFLSENNLHDYIDPNELDALSPYISIQERANCIRMMLLERYGGVWVDATTYCTGPLEAWLPDDVKDSGFFAYSFQDADRPMGNWFMAAHKDSYIVRAFNQRFLNFWRKKRKLRLVDEPYKLKIKRLRAGRYFNRNPWLWNSFLMVNVLKRYHYFIFHYMFGQLIAKDERFRELWDKAGKRSSYDAHILLRHGLGNPVTPEMRSVMDDPEHKVFKLSWKEILLPEEKGNVFDYLESKLGHNSPSQEV